MLDYGRTMDSTLQRCARSVVSYVPAPSLLAARRVRDLPQRLRKRPHESEFAALGFFDWNTATSSTPLVLDIGANRGQSIRSVRMVLDHPRIVAVEPNPHLAAYLERAFGESVQVLNKGIAAEAGSVTLNVPRYGHTLYDTRASIDRAEAESFVSSEHFAGFRPDRAGIEAYSVEVLPVDALDLAPDIMKVDVEGMDHLVVEGALGTIDRCGPLLLVEEPQPATREMLRARSYEAYGFDAPARALRRGDTSGLNTFFCQESHLALIDSTGLAVLDR